MNLVLVFLATVAFGNAKQDEIITDPGVSVTTEPGIMDSDGVDLLAILAEMGVYEFAQSYAGFQGVDLSDVKKVIKMTCADEGILFCLTVDVDPFGQFDLMFTYDPDREKRIVIVNNQYLLVSEVREYQYQVFPGQFETRTGEFVSVVDTDGEQLITAPKAGGLPTSDCENLLADENRLRGLLPYHPFPPATAYEPNGSFFTRLGCADMPLTLLLNYKITSEQYVFSDENEIIFIDGEIQGDDAQIKMQKIQYVLTALRGVFQGRLVF